MFIVHCVGIDDENPFKIFASGDDARKEAEDRARGDVERVFVYEWSGGWEEGLAAAKEGRLEPKMHFPHRDAPRVAPPEKALHLSEQSKKLLSELVKKMPKIARKF